VDVRLVVDAKINERTDSNGIFQESFPREENLRMLARVGIPEANVTLRKAKPRKIQHNKFMVLVRGGTPAEVWTGSTNISLGGFSGQTNVGHWVRDTEVARQFVAYWELIQTDPGAGAGLSRSEARKANSALHKAVATLRTVPTSVDMIPPGTTAVFSPRAGLDVLNMYIRMVDSAKSCACITLAFGINDAFKKELQDNTDLNHVIFMLLEKRDLPRKGSKTPFVPLSMANNVYQAWGSYIKDPVYHWATETNARLLRINSHVAYVHSKFLLMDPLGSDPIIVTGSANFSKASTNDNDENMLLIRGDQRVADIYFTEFNRLFSHYYVRSIMEELKDRGRKPSPEAGVFLSEKPEDWLSKYQPGKLKTKRLQLFTQMEGAGIL
jgi:phosphatidylserine/phosphatidylglycerophosphate/cardiolipin synthase-like enzyme